MMFDLIIPPGIAKTGAKLPSAGRWQDGNLVRWHEGVCQPIGGAETYADGTVGTAQSTMLFQDLLGAWTLTGVTNTTGQTDPKSTTEAELLTEDTSTGNHEITQTATVTASDECRLSVYLKANGRTKVRLKLSNGTDGTVAQADFDLSAVTATADTGTASIAAANLSYYRCEIVGTPTIASNTAAISLMDGANVSYTGDGASGAYYWRAQLRDDSEHPRSSFGWIDNSAAAYLAVGTNKGCYRMTRGGGWEDITPSGFTGGDSESGTNTGYGMGVYGVGTYGTPRTSTVNPITNAAATWSFAAWGENLIGCMRGTNSVYEWAPGGGAMAAVSGAPSSPQCLTVSASRQLIVGKVRTVYFSDTEDNTTWTAAATNQAGEQLLETSGYIREIVRVQDEILIFTTTDVWAMRYIGPPEVFSFERVGDKCGIASPQGVAVVGDLAAWVSDEQFYTYNGQVNPLPCQVQDYVRTDIKRGQISRAFAWANNAYSEIWWCYQSPSGDDIDSYVSWNHKYDFWMIGKLSRNTAVDSAPLAAVVMLDHDGNVYQHEKVGVAHSTAPHVTTGPVSPTNGQSTVHVNRLFPDEAALGDVQVTITGRRATGGAATSYGPYTVAVPTNTRAAGADLDFKYEFQTGSGRVGNFRVEYEDGGAR